MMACITGSLSGNRSVRTFQIVSLQCFLIQKKRKKVIARSIDFAMGQYVSWCLLADEINVNTVCSIYEEFCKSQANEV